VGSRNFSGAGPFIPLSAYVGANVPGTCPCKTQANKEICHDEPVEVVGSGGLWRRPAGGGESDAGGDGVRGRSVLRGVGRFV
jgi:hypothetical protein